MQTYVVIREGLFLTEFVGGAIGWTERRTDATVYFDKGEALQKAINFRGFVLANADEGHKSPAGYCTVRLTMNVARCPVSVVAVHGVARQDVYGLQREMVAHLIKVENLLSAMIQIDPPEN